jgi:hypothetical protein
LQICSVPDGRAANHPLLAVTFNQPGTCVLVHFLLPPSSLLLTKTLSTILRFARGNMRPYENNGFVSLKIYCTQRGQYISYTYESEVQLYIILLKKRCLIAQADKDKHREMVIEALNKARAMELHAIHQYMNQHHSLDNWDNADMASKVKLIGIDEMPHAEMFADRIS